MTDRPAGTSVRGAPPSPAQLRVGAHVGLEDPLAAAAERGAECVQFFLADPQGWQIPAERPDQAALAAAAMPLYVHAPYGINLASPNNRIRIPSRKLLADACAAAGRVGATAVIVHGGHVTGGEDESEGFARWRKALERLESPVQLLLENTAGGSHAMARHLDTVARLWEQIGDFGIGFCLDTCHAYASGEPLDGIVDRVRAITGRLDLVHANDSRDPAGSARDRHENVGRGEIGVEAIAEIVRCAGTDVICETPGEAAGQRADIDLLRATLRA